MSVTVVQFMYLHRNTSLMQRILFEVLQGNTAIFSILDSLKKLTTTGRNFHRSLSQQLCYYVESVVKTPVSFPSDKCVDEAVGNQTNYQR